MLTQSCPILLDSYGLESVRLLSPLDFSRHEYWSGLPFPLPEGLPNPEIEPTSPASSALADKFFITEPPGKPPSPTRRPVANEKGFLSSPSLDRMKRWGWGYYLVKSSSASMCLGIGE